MKILRYVRILLFCLVCFVWIGLCTLDVPERERAVSPPPEREESTPEEVRKFAAQMLCRDSFASGLGREMTPEWGVFSGNHWQLWFTTERDNITTVIMQFWLEGPQVRQFVDIRCDVTFAGQTPLFVSFREPN